MLYDNAQLARVYLHAYQITGNDFYKRVTIEILDYVVREMTDANGGFYSSQDADSEGHEGKFFVWTPEEIRSALGGSSSGLLIVSKTKSDTVDAGLVMDAYGVSARGNFEGENILHRARDNEVLAAMHKLDEAEIERKLNDAKQKLFHARERRVKPARDEKILTGWNGLMLAAFAEAARVFKIQESQVESREYEELARLLEGREAREGMATVYVCEKFACQMPVWDTEALKVQLDADPDKKKL